MDWSRFLRLLLGSLAVSLLVCVGLVVAMNPYGNLPQVLFREHVITDGQQRFQFPGVVRTKRFDSAIFGTSSIRLLDPADLEPELGGTFANFAMNDARAWEQYMLMKLFLRHSPKVRTIVFGIDSVWCWPDADTQRVTRRTFPEWMFDENPWNDWLYLINYRALEISARQVGVRLGFMEAAMPSSGFRVFTPPEDKFDIERARQYLYGQGPRVLPPAQAPPIELSPAERDALRFPALDWLKEIAAEAPAETRMTFLFVPTHSVNIAASGSRAAAEYAECRRRIVAIAGSRNASVVDFRFRSALTDVDENFWDPLHYRLPVAKAIASAILGAMVRGQARDETGTWTAIPGHR